MGSYQKNISIGGEEKMKARIIKRVLTATLAAALVLVPSMGTLASTKSAAVTGNITPATVATVSYKTSSSVAGVKSSIDGVWITNEGVTGVVTTPAATVAAALGLGAGERPLVKVYDVDERKSNLAWGSATGAAAAYGGTIYGSLNVELGKMAAGKYSLTTAGAVAMSFNVPAKAQAGNVAVVCVQPGGAVTILRDTDTNPATVSVSIPAGQSMLAFITY
jgi:hypothetical protein